MAATNERPLPPSPAPARRTNNKRRHARESTAGTLLVSVIEQVPITAVKTYATNARAHNDRQIRKLAGIIQQVGFLVPIIVDETSTIIAGHGRWAAAKELGLATLPVIRADHLTPHQVQAFRLADNRLGELSSWDKTTLALELKSLAAIELDPDILDLTGFETAEIGGLIEPPQGTQAPQAPYLQRG
jgi:ParB-like chromosome segregation protein Spo0J